MYMKKQNTTNLNMILDNETREKITALQGRGKFTMASVVRTAIDVYYQMEIGGNKL